MSKRAASPTVASAAAKKTRQQIFSQRYNDTHPARSLTSAQAAIRDIDLARIRSLGEFDVNGPIQFEDWCVDKKVDELVRKRLFELYFEAAQKGIPASRLDDNTPPTVPASVSQPSSANTPAVASSSRAGPVLPVASSSAAGSSPVKAQPLASSSSSSSADEGGKLIVDDLAERFAESDASQTTPIGAAQAMHYVSAAKSKKKKVLLHLPGEPDPTPSTAKGIVNTLLYVAFAFLLQTFRLKYGDLSEFFVTIGIDRLTDLVVGCMDSFQRALLFAVFSSDGPLSIAHEAVRANLKAHPMGGVLGAGISGIVYAVILGTATAASAWYRGFTAFPDLRMKAHQAGVKGGNEIFFYRNFSTLFQAGGLGFAAMRLGQVSAGVPECVAWFLEWTWVAAIGFNPASALAEMMRIACRRAGVPLLARFRAWSANLASALEARAQLGDIPFDSELWAYIGTIPVQIRKLQVLKGGTLINGYSRADYKNSGRPVHLNTTFLGAEITVNLLPAHRGMMPTSNIIPIRLFVARTDADKIVVIMETTIGAKFARTVLHQEAPPGTVSELSATFMRYILNNFSIDMLPLVSTLTSSQQTDVAAAGPAAPKVGIQVRSDRLKTMSSVHEVTGTRRSTNEKFQVRVFSCTVGVAAPSGLRSKAFLVGICRTDPVARSENTYPVAANRLAVFFATQKSPEDTPVVHHAPLTSDLRLTTRSSDRVDKRIEGDLFGFSNIKKKDIKRMEKFVTEEQLLKLFKKQK